MRRSEATVRDAGLAAVSVVLGGGLALPVFIACVAPVLPVIAAQRGGGRSAELFAQSLLTIPSLGAILGGIAAGLLFTRAGIRLCLLFAALVYAASSLIGMVAESGSIILGSRVTGGFAAALIATGSVELIGTLFGAVLRQRFIGWRSAFMSASGIALIVGAGFLAEAAGAMSVFLLPTGFALLLIPFILLARIPRGPPPEERAVLRLRLDLALPSNIWTLLLLVLVLSVIGGIPGVQVPFKLSQIGVNAPSVQGLLIAISPVMMVIGGMLFEPVNRRFGHLPLFPAAVISIGLGCALIGLSNTILPVAIGMSAIALGIAFGFPYLIASLVGAASELQRGTVLGYSTTALALGAVSNPFIVLPFTLWLGLDGTLLLLGALTSSGGLLSLAFRRNLATDRTSDSSGDRR